MHALARKFFFIGRVFIKDLLETRIEAEGLYLNWLGRNLPFVVLAAWAGLMLAFAI